MNLSSDIGKNLWLEKFKKNNLEIIDDKINTVCQYIEEYKKVSYSFYTASHVVDMVMNTNYRLYKSMCFFGSFFTIDNLKNILDKDHPIFLKLKEDDNDKKYIDISIEIKEKGSIYYGLHDNNDEYSERTNLLIENYDNINIIISLINKILYYHPSITINDVDCIPIIIPKNLVFDDDDLNYYKNRIDSRKEYWDKCDREYEELYF